MPRGIYLDANQIHVLYSQGLSDQVIAERSGTHKKSIARWRRVRGLQSNVKQGRPKLLVSEAQNES